METHAPPQADADYLTAALRKSGALSGNGRVVAAAVVHTFPTILSRFHRLKLEYEGAADAPRLLYLKTGLPDGPGAALDSGRREVAFYDTVAPATPPDLLPRCFAAEIAPDGAWHLLLEDLTDTARLAGRLSAHGAMGNHTADLAAQRRHLTGDLVAPCRAHPSRRRRSRLPGVARLALVGPRASCALSIMRRAEARGPMTQFNLAAWAITSIASGWRERTLRESAPESSQAR